MDSKKTLQLSLLHPQQRNFELASDVDIAFLEMIYYDKKL